MFVFIKLCVELILKSSFNLNNYKRDTIKIIIQGIIRSIPRQNEILLNLNAFDKDCNNSRSKCGDATQVAKSSICQKLDQKPIKRIQMFIKWLVTQNLYHFWLETWTNIFITRVKMHGFPLLSATQKSTLSIFKTALLCLVSSQHCFFFFFFST